MEDNYDESLEEAARMFSRMPLEALTYTLDDALKGATSVDVMRDYIRVAADCIKGGVPLPDKLRDFIQSALRDISFGEDANKALRLKIGHKRPDDRVKDVGIAYAVWDLVNRQEANVDEAFRLVGNAKNKSPERVREIYYLYKNSIDAEISDKAPRAIPE